MKLIVILACTFAFLFILEGTPTYAMVEVTCFHESYIREKGKKNTVTEVFISAHAGDGKITITNGDPNDPKTKPISSARIWLNGVLICVPNDWNQNVTLLEIPVTLKEGENKLKVLLYGPQRGKISLAVTQELTGYESHTKLVESEKVVVDSVTGIKFVVDQVLISFKDNIPPEEIQNIINDINGIVVGYLPISKLYQIQLLYTPLLTPEELNELVIILNTNSNVNLASHNRVRSELLADPNDPYPRDPLYPDDPVQWNEQLPRGYNWGLEAIKMLSAWEVTKGGTDVKVGVVEFGFYLEHEDILGAPNIDSNCIKPVPASANMLENDTEPPTPLPCSPTMTVAQSRNGHGTHVLGIIGAISDNGMGITGIMWEKALFVYKVSENENGEFDDPALAEGIEELLKNGVQVINFSIGYDWPSASGCNNCWKDTSLCPSIMNTNHVKWMNEERKFWQDKMDEWLKSAKNPETPIKDFLIVQAAGNSNIESVWGGNFNTIIKEKYKNHIMVVGSISPPADSNLIYELSNFSNYGDLIDIVAPGGEWAPPNSRLLAPFGIHSTIWSFPSYNGVPFEGYATMAGTSMAAPHVAGVAGLVWNLAKDHVVGGELTATQVKNILRNSTDIIATNDDGSDQNEYKVLNAINAVNYVVLPKVTLFEIDKTTAVEGESITATYIATDYKGLDRVELWRAPDSDGTAGTWEYLTSVDISGTSPPLGEITDDDSNAGAWWYGIHVYDTDGKCTTEKNEDCATGESNGGPNLALEAPIIVDKVIIICADIDGDDYDACEPGDAGDDNNPKDCDDINSTVYPGAGNDTTPPIVESFKITPTTLSVTELVNAEYEVSDNISLARAELWRATFQDNLCDQPTKDYCEWEPVGPPQVVSGTIDSGTFSDEPPAGLYYYGLHVVDKACNWATEPAPILVTVIDEPIFPSVVSTDPPNGETGVSVGLEEALVIFNKSMKTQQGTSITASANWPLPGASHEWLDDKTITIHRNNDGEPLPYGEEIWFILNPPGYQAAFEDTEGNILETQTFSFTTELGVQDFPVSFPDPNLEAAVREAISKPTGDIMYSELQDLIYLDAQLREIQNIEGINYCSKLSELIISDNLIKDINPLSGLVNLETLQLYTNRITDISPLTNLSNLRELNLWNNQISDFSPLSYLVKLERLHLAKTLITDLTPLSGLYNLKILGLADNDIDNIEPLSRLVNLSRLMINNNQITDLTALSGLTSLTYLELDRNQVNDISPLVNNFGITGNSDAVYLFENPLNADSCYNYIPQLEARSVTVYHDCAGIIIQDPNLEAAIREAINKPTGTISHSDLQGLTSLDASSRGIWDLDGIEFCTNLTVLDLHSNDIHYIGPLVDLTNLIDLDFSYNVLEDGNLTFLTGLENLSILNLSSNYNINNIEPLLSLFSLGTLDLRGNTLASISCTTHIPQLEESGVTVYHDCTPISDPRVSSESGQWGDRISQPGWGFTPYGTANLRFRHESGCVETDAENVSPDGTYQHDFPIPDGKLTGTWYYSALDVESDIWSPEVSYAISASVTIFP